MEEMVVVVVMMVVGWGRGLVDTVMARYRNVRADVLDILKKDSRVVSPNKATWSFWVSEVWEREKVLMTFRKTQPLFDLLASGRPLELGCTRISQSMSRCSYFR